MLILVRDDDEDDPGLALTSNYDSSDDAWRAAWCSACRYDPAFWLRMTRWIDRFQVLEVSGIVEYLHVSLQDHVVYKIWYKICSLICWFSLAGLSSMVRRAGPVYWQDNGLPGEAPLPLSEAQHMIIYATCRAGVIPSVENNCLYHSISGESNH